MSILRMLPLKLTLQKSFTSSQGQQPPRQSLVAISWTWSAIEHDKGVWQICLIRCSRWACRADAIFGRRRHFSGLPIVHQCGEKQNDESGLSKFRQ